MMQLLSFGLHYDILTFIIILLSDLSTPTLFYSYGSYLLLVVSLIQFIVGHSTRARHTTKPSMATPACNTPYSFLLNTGALHIIPAYRIPLF